MRRFAAVVVTVLVAGCGFRSGLDGSAVHLEAAIVDQPTFLQGQSGEMEIVLRNDGPMGVDPLQIVEQLTLVTTVGESSYEPSALLSVRPPEVPEEIPARSYGSLKYPFTVLDDAPTGYTKAVVSLSDGEPDVEVSFTLLRAASLQVTAAVIPEGFPGHACRGARSTRALVTVENVGASSALVAEPSLRVFSPEDLDVTDDFVWSWDVEPPTSIEPGAEAQFVLDFNPIAGAPLAVPYEGFYEAYFGAVVTDATTERTRAIEHIATPVKFHVEEPATLTIEVLESANTITTAQPNTGTLGVSLSNSGTVAGNALATLQTFVATSDTTSQYSFIPTGNNSGQVAPGGQLMIVFQGQLTSTTPTLGLTQLRARVDLDDPICARNLDLTSPDGASGAWTVE